MRSNSFTRSCTCGRHITCQHIKHKPFETIRLPGQIRLTRLVSSPSFSTPRLIRTYVCLQKTRLLRGSPMSTVYSMPRIIPQPLNRCTSKHGGHSLTPGTKSMLLINNSCPVSAPLQVPEQNPKFRPLYTNSYNHIYTIWELPFIIEQTSTRRFNKKPSTYSFLFVYMCQKERYVIAFLFYIIF